MPSINHLDSYYPTSDIDWFCCLNGVNIHVASMGRKIPAAVEANLDSIYAQVSKIEMTPLTEEDFWFNRAILEQWLQIKEPIEVARYLYSFSVMARKGFFSFAPITLDPTDDDYYLMVKPFKSGPRIHGLYCVDQPNLEMESISAFQAIPLVKYFEPDLSGELK